LVIEILTAGFVCVVRPCHSICF